MEELFSKVNSPKLSVKLRPDEGVCVLGSCFADCMSARLTAAGFDVCANPFGTLYNPVSIASSIQRLDSGLPFTAGDCIEMGSGAGLICSFSHHTSFARSDAAQFLSNANKALSQSSEHWKRCRKVIITLGTARVWKHIGSGVTVSNCLKRPASEFTHEMLPPETVTDILKSIVETHPDKDFIMTVSPIRHLGSGAHDNSLSKATLLLGIENLGSGISYFPSYEILLDELRDYRFYAEDLVHPSKTAVDIIWERFIEAAVLREFHEWIRQNERAARRMAHRPMITE